MSSLCQSFYGKNIFAPYKIGTWSIGYESLIPALYGKFKDTLSKDSILAWEDQNEKVSCIHTVVINCIPVLYEP